MKTCDICKEDIFRIDFKVYGIDFICVLCGYEETYYFENYDE